MQTIPGAEAVIDVQDDPTDPMCSVCSHPQEAHDAIAARYCAATLGMAMPRGCICKVATPAK